MLNQRRVYEVREVFVFFITAFFVGHGGVDETHPGGESARWGMNTTPVFDVHNW